MSATIVELENTNITECLGYTKDMTKESDRIKSFHDFHWTNKYISGETLAKAGFYYYGESDVVRCAFCNTDINNWKENDVPLECHRKFAEHCIFLKKLGYLNSVSEDTCGPYGIKDKNQSAHKDADTIKKYLHDYAYPGYSLIQKRVHSFADWPKSLKQKPKDLANAGFYYTGRNDETICFDCGIGLNGWEEDDDPWEQHALWTNNCEYIKMFKGDKYIDNVKSKYNTEKLCENSNNSEEKADEKAIINTISAKEDLNTICKVCLNDESNIVVLPCKHLAVCASCSQHITKCVVCRQLIENILKIYVS